MLKKILALSCVLLQVGLAGTANAEFLSLDSHFGKDTVVYDTQTKLGWLDISATMSLDYEGVTNALKNDARFDGFNMASYAQYETLINNLFPSLFTASSFYQGIVSKPFVDPEEGGKFRELFGVGRQVTSVFISDGETLRWAASNSWREGHVAYTDIYYYPSGTDEVKDATRWIMSDISSNAFGWFVVAEGEADLNSSSFVRGPSDVSLSSPVSAGLLSMACVMLWRRKKEKTVAC